MKSDARAVAAALLAADAVAVTSHLAPDGDGLGSGLALVRALRRLGRKADFVSRDPVPRRYAFLPDSETVLQLEKVGRDYTTVVLVECPELERCGLAGLDAKQLINIDHHALNSNFGDLDWVDPRAAAVGEQIYALLPLLGVQLDRELATQLYTALLTDTGSFRYSNTNRRSFEIAAELVSAGCDPAQVAREVYEQQPLGQLLLLRQVLESLELSDCGRIAWITLREDQLRRLRDAGLDTEELINYPRSIAGVQVALFFKQLGAEQVKVSLRSSGAVDVAELAAGFGGGGHKQAAGCSVAGNLDTVRARFLALLDQQLAPSS